MKKIMLLAITAIFTLFACNESSTTTEEKEQINVMDSTEKKVKNSTEQLKEQTEKLEDALEKLDKEFKDTTR